MLFLTILVVGGAATLRIPVELIPGGYDDPFLWVNVPWSNAPVKEVLDKVALPLEEELSTVRGIKTLWAVAAVGGGRVFISFKQGTDMDVAYREVRDRVERARVRFPDDIDRVFINKDDDSGIPVHMLGIAVDPEIQNPYDLIRNQLAKRLSRVDGVAAVNVHGLLEKEIMIELDREKTSAAGLNIFELAQELGNDNFSMASGTVREGSRKLMLRSIARFDGLEQLENRFVGSATRLKDVAQVSYKQPQRDFRVRAMSRPAVAVEVLKEGDANAREVANAVNAELERIDRDPRFAGLFIRPFLDQGKLIDEALRTLFNSGMIGGAIAFVVLMFFLRRIRLTLILALAIPLSILIGLTVMYFGGESLNLLTLLGLMLCVGLLVDNSVVVAENIHRLHRGGMPRRDACVHGAGEVGLAITMSTLTTIVVFAPVALVEGPGQFFLMRLALPVCVSVAASLFVALVFIPLCVYLTLPTRDSRRQTGLLQRTHDRGVGLLRRIYDATLERVNQAYNSMLAFFLKRRWDLIIAVMLVWGVTAAVPMQNVAFVPIQEEQHGGFSIEVHMPQTNTLEETEQWFLEAEKILEGVQDEVDIEGWWHNHGKTDGAIHAWFKRPRTNDLKRTEIVERVKEELPVRPGMDLRINNTEEGRDSEGGNAVYVVAINGEDPDQLEHVRSTLEDFFSGVEGVLGVRGGNEPPPNELGLVVDRDKTQRYGVNPQHIAGVVSTSLMGMQLPRYHQDGKEVPVRVRYEERDRESLTELVDFHVPTASGGSLPLSAVTDTEFLPTQQKIIRRNKRMGRAVALELEQGKEDETRKRLLALQAGIDLPEGISFGNDAQQQDFNDDLGNMGYALIISVVLIYLLMGFLFESFVLPLSIVFTIPLSIIGVYWAHFFVGMDVDFLGVVAMILLVGVVVNNGIVLIDYVNRLRGEGRSRTEAVLAATHRRFRPIMMTAITTIGGLVPLALAGSNSMGFSYSSFSMTLIGGMTTATLLTLLVVPVLYTLFDDARAACSAALGRALGRRVATEPTVA